MHAAYKLIVHRRLLRVREGTLESLRPLEFDLLRGRGVSSLSTTIKKSHTGPCEGLEARSLIREMGDPICNTSNRSCPF